MPHPQRVEIMPCRGMRETQRALIVPRLRRILTRRILGACHSMKYVKRDALDCFTVVACEKRAAFGACFAVGYEKQAAFWGCHEVGGGNRGAFACPCVGAQKHTPSKRPSEGGRGPCLWSCTGIRHPWDGALWGVCNTPLP